MKNKFIFCSAIVMALFPILGGYVPFLNFFYSAYLGPVQIVNAFLRSVLNINIGSTLYYYAVSIIVWFIIGFIWGYILFNIKNKGVNQNTVKFGLSAFLVTLIIQVLIGYVFLYLGAYIYNTIFFGK